MSAAAAAAAVELVVIAYLLIPLLPSRLTDEVAEHYPAQRCACCILLLIGANGIWEGMDIHGCPRSFNMESSFKRDAQMDVHLPSHQVVEPCPILIANEPADEPPVSGISSVQVLMQQQTSSSSVCGIRNQPDRVVKTWPAASFTCMHTCHGKLSVPRAPTAGPASPAGPQACPQQQPPA